VPTQAATRTQRRESLMKDFDPGPELADLRRAWGDAYRITWNGNHFRATHVISGQALDAATATDLRMLIRNHHSREATHSRLPGASDAASRIPPTSGRRNRGG
jgi:hypothetical protein